MYLLAAADFLQRTFLGTFVLQSSGCQTLASSQRRNGEYSLSRPAAGVANREHILTVSIHHRDDMLRRSAVGGGLTIRFTP